MEKDRAVKTSTAKSIEPSAMLIAALQYREKGFSVIPCGKDKTPLIKWLPHQEKRATEEEIRQWWAKWPNANIGIITGKISGITVLDFDSQEGVENFLANFKGVTPCVDTPRGMHAYFAYEDGIRNTVKVNGFDIDVRSDGGYVIAPPSVNAEGKQYKWIRSILDTPCESLPESLKESILKDSAFLKGDSKGGKGSLDSFSLSTHIGDEVKREMDFK